jgi:hypothetical protein
LFSCCNRACTSARSSHMFCWFFSRVAYGGEERGCGGPLLICCKQNTNKNKRLQTFSRLSKQQFRYEGGGRPREGRGGEGGGGGQHTTIQTCPCHSRLVLYLYCGLVVFMGCFMLCCVVSCLCVGFCVCRMVGDCVCGVFVLCCVLLCVVVCCCL